MKLDKLVILSVVLCAVVLAGELTTYGANFHSYDSSADFGDGRIDLSVTSSGSDVYSAVLVDNGTRPPVTELYIYIDERYDEFLEDARSASGLRPLDMEYAIEQVCKSLRIRGFDNISVCNDKELLEIMLGDSAGSASKGLLVMSYALPVGIYSGSDGDVLFKWLAAGGSLYWM